MMVREGKAMAVSVPSNTSEAFAFDVSIDGLTEGNHQFSLRAKDDSGKWSVVRSEPFTITQAGNGIAQVTWDFPIDIRLLNGLCTVIDKGNGSRGNSRVEIYTLSGMMLASTDWPKGVSTLTLSINQIANGSVLMIKVIDTERGMNVVRRLAMRAM